MSWTRCCQPCSAVALVFFCECECTAYNVFSVGYDNVRAFEISSNTMSVGGTKGIRASFFFFLFFYYFRHNNHSFHFTLEFTVELSGGGSPNSCVMGGTLDNPNNVLYLLPAHLSGAEPSDCVCQRRSYRAARTDAGSSRYSGSFSPSSCLVYIGSRAEGWTAAPSWRSHTGFAPRAPASHCRPPPHTAWGCAVAGCRCRRWSRCLRHAGSPSRPSTEPYAGLLQDKADKTA